MDVLCLLAERAGEVVLREEIISHVWLTRIGSDESLTRAIAIEKAESRAPHHPRYAVWAHYRGHCEIKLGEVERAIAAYEAGVARNPAYGLNLVTLTAAYEFAGDHDRADETLAHVVAANPAYRPADLDTLARRMIYWFAKQPSRDEFTDAFRAVWERRRGA